MAHNAPGKHYRKGITLVSLIRMFPDDSTARDWFESRIWPDGPFCPFCGSKNVQCGIAHPSQTHRCRDCERRPRFSVRTNTVMQDTKLGYRTWAIAIYLHATGIKGVSSMKLHRDLGITQRTAWFLSHRLRKAFEDGELAAFAGPVEVDECFIGGKESNKHADKKLNEGRGAVGKSIVLGMKDRDTNRIVARVVPDTKSGTVQPFVLENTREDAAVHTDEAQSYKGLDRLHETVCHSAGEYVRRMVHVNGIESFWALLKRGYEGIYHHMSRKHLKRYVAEFAGRHNIRVLDTLDQMSKMVAGMRGKRLKYRELTA